MLVCDVLIIWRCRLSRPIGWCVSACSRILAESGARLGDLLSRFFWVPVRSAFHVPSWRRISVPEFPALWVPIGRCVSVGNDTVGRFMLVFVSRSIRELQVGAVKSYNK